VGRGEEENPKLRHDPNKTYSAKGLLTKGEGRANEILRGGKGRGQRSPTVNSCPKERDATPSLQEEDQTKTGKEPPSLERTSEKS